MFLSPKFESIIYTPTRPIDPLDMTKSGIVLQTVLLSRECCEQGQSQSGEVVSEDMIFLEEEKFQRDKFNLFNPQQNPLI